MKEQYPEYTNSEIRDLINELIHHRRNRDILIAHFIDGDTYEQIAAANSLSVRHVATVIANGRNIIFPRLANHPEIS